MLWKLGQSFTEFAEKLFSLFFALCYHNVIMILEKENRYLVLFYISHLFLLYDIIILKKLTAA